MQLKYKAAQPDKGFKKFVGLNFKCSVIRYSVQKSTRDRNGKVVDGRGGMEMKVQWIDAPASCKVVKKGVSTSIVGLIQSFTFEEFHDAYEVVKTERVS